MWNNNLGVREFLNNVFLHGSTAISQTTKKDSTTKTRNLNNFSSSYQHNTILICELH